VVECGASPKGRRREIRRPRPSHLLPSGHGKAATETRIRPAIEYNWTANLGVLLGARVIAAGRNTAATITPALAINYVR
jgi:hypothetical protein